MVKQELIGYKKTYTGLIKCIVQILKYKTNNTLIIKELGTFELKGKVLKITLNTIEDTLDTAIANYVKK